MKEIILFYIDTVSEGVINLLKIIEKQQCHVRRELYSHDCGKKKPNNTIASYLQQEAEYKS